MKKIFFASLLITSSFVQAQNKIKLDKGQKFETNTVVNMSMNMEQMGQSIEINSNINTTNQLEVKMVSKDSSVVASTLSKMKLTGSAMGQDMNYDSENPADKDSEIGKTLSKSIGQTTEVTVNETGKIVNVKKPIIADNESEGMMDMLSGGAGTDGTDTGVKGIFANFNTAKVKAGDTWMDSSVADKNKIVNTYLVKEIKGDEISVNIISVESKSFTKEQQGMEVLITSEIKSTGDYVYEKSTGFLKGSNVVAEGAGNAEVMGMTIPMTTKTTTAITVKKM
jgi:Family of unknown function (DUF6263)